MNHSAGIRAGFRARISTRIAATMGTAAPLALCWAMGGAMPAMAAPAVAVRPVTTDNVPDPAATAEEAYHAGKAALADGNPRAALAHFRSALRRDPAYVAALSGAGASLDQLGRSDLARPYFEAALAAQPDAPDLMYNLGLSLAMAGYTERARGLLARAAARGNGEVKARSSTLLASLDGAMAPGRAVQRAEAPAMPDLQGAAEPATALAAANAATQSAAPLASPGLAAVDAAGTGLAPPMETAMVAAVPEQPPLIASEAAAEPLMLADAAAAAPVPIISGPAMPAPVMAAVAAASFDVPGDPALPLMPAGGDAAVVITRNDTGEWQLALPPEPAQPVLVAAVPAVVPAAAAAPPRPALALAEPPPPITPPRPRARLAARPEIDTPAPALAAPVVAAAVPAAPPQPATARLAATPPQVAAPVGGLDRLAAALSAMMPVGNGPGLAGLPDGLVPRVPFAAGRRRRRTAAA